MAPDIKGRVAWLRIMLIVAALFIATPDFAAERSVISECRWAEGPIVIDGKANEPAWKNAQVIDHFGMAWLGEGEHPAPTKTRARLLWRREYLYSFAEMEA